MRIEKELQLNRKDVENVILTAKAKLLKEHMKTFENIDISSIVECLHYQRKQQLQLILQCTNPPNYYEQYKVKLEKFV